MKFYHEEIITVHILCVFLHRLMGLIMLPWLAWNPLYRPVYPATHRELPSSASQALELTGVHHHTSL